LLAQQGIIINTRQVAWLASLEVGNVGCCVYGCKNWYGEHKGLGFFRIPSTQMEMGCSVAAE